MAEEIDIAAMNLARQIRTEEERDTLLQLLVWRFGPLSTDARDRIQAADRRLLTRWFERLGRAESIDDVLAQ